jgi:hypothetical protein
MIPDGHLGLAGDVVRPLGFPEKVALKTLLMIVFGGRPRAPAIAADEVLRYIHRDAVHQRQQLGRESTGYGNGLNGGAKW